MIRIRTAIRHISKKSTGLLSTLLFVLPITAHAATPNEITASGNSSIAIASPSASSGVSTISSTGVGPFSSGYTISYVLNVDTAGTYQLRMAYNAPTSTSGFTVLVNGTSMGNLLAPQTTTPTQFLTSAPLKITLPKGSVTLTLNSISGTSLLVYNALSISPMTSANVIIPSGTSSLAIGSPSAASGVSTITPTLVGGFGNGSSISYSLSVATAGTYQIQMNAATNVAGSAFNVTANGGASMLLSAPPTNSLTTYMQTPPQNITLPAGTVTLKLTPTSGAAINYTAITFTGGSTSTAPTNVINNVGTSEIAIASPSAKTNVTTVSSTKVGPFVGGSSISYALNVVSAGYYTLQMRTAVWAANSNFSVSAAGVSCGNTNIPNTNSSTTYYQYELNYCYLPAGANTITLTALTGSEISFNEFALVSSAGVTPPVITAFTASKTPLTAGASDTLSWSTTGATSVSITGVSGTLGASGGSTTITPTATTTYTLTAKNTVGGSATKTVTVTVLPVPVISAFTVAKTTIASGAADTLTWATTGATEVSITNIYSTGTWTAEAFSGSTSVAPTATTTYTLTATNGAGTAVTKALSVTAIPLPMINTFTASKASSTSGAADTLSWTTTGATSVSISGVTATLATASGTTSVTPTATTTYTMTAKNSLGSTVTKSVTVTVVPPPVITSFTTAKSSISSGTAGLLSWATTGASSVTITNVYQTGTSSPVALSSFTSVAPTATTTYTLTATNSAGTAVSKSLTVTVIPLPVISAFTVSKTTLTSGSNETFSWSTSNATSINISGVPGSFVAGTGSVTAYIVSTGSSQLTYTLTATNSAGGTATKSLTITLVQMPVISAFAASKPLLSAGASDTLSWTTTGASTVTISGVTGTLAVASGSVNVTPTATTTYTLTATNSSGVSATKAISVAVPPAIGNVVVAPSPFNSCTPIVANKYSSNIAKATTGLQTATVLQRCKSITAANGMDFKSSSLAVVSNGTLKSNLRLRTPTTPDTTSYKLVRASSGPIQVQSPGVWCGNSLSLADASAPNVLHGAPTGYWQNNPEFCAFLRQPAQYNTNQSAFLEVDLASPQPISFVTYYESYFAVFPVSYVIYTKNASGTWVNQGTFTTQPDSNTRGAKVLLVNVPVASAIKMVPVEFGKMTSGDTTYGFGMYGVTAGYSPAQPAISTTAVSAMVNATTLQCMPLKTSKQLSSAVPGLKTTTHGYHCMGKGQNYYSNSVTKFMNGNPIVTSHTIVPVSQVSNIVSQGASIRAKFKTSAVPVKLSANGSSNLAASRNPASVASETPSITSKVSAAVVSVFNKVIGLVSGGSK